MFDPVGGLELSPDAARFLAMPLPRPPRLRGTDLDVLRRAEQELAAVVGGEGESLHGITEGLVNGVRIRTYVPRNQATTALVWFHGGAFMLGGLHSCEAMLRMLANRSGVQILSVDYRLAPENPYPAALEDCWSVVEWAADRFAAVLVGGDSAGGTLAAAVALRARDARLSLDGQILVYPALDSNLDAPYRSEFLVKYASFVEQDFALDSIDALRFAWEQYVPDPARRTDQQAAPLHAHTLRGVAPALLIAAEHDPLRWEAERFASRLHQDGVANRLACFAGQIHGFVTMPGLMREAGLAVDMISAFVCTGPSSYTS